ncbi:MAG: D-alanine--D-alanine ligase [Deltaproteobacteria bacterium]|nr:D-alanine--D-alanine ligase [Deltaproteobacteria bacterium]
MAEKKRVGIVFGGLSSEREVSLNSGRNVHDNLDTTRYEPVALFLDERARLWHLPWKLISQNTTVDISERLAEEAKWIPYEALKTEIDFAFICLHGKYGDDGCIQGVLELLGIPYTGAGVLASALGMDKYLQQMILRADGIGVPHSRLVVRRVWENDQAGVLAALQEEFSLAVVTKPTREGSSVGVTIIRNWDELPQGIAVALQWDNAVLVEEFIEGIEFSCIVLENERGTEVLEITEIHPQSEFFTYDDKYMPGRCRKITPPKSFSPAICEQIRRDVLRAFRSLGFRSYGRIDGFYTSQGEVLITDPNSSSGMAPSSFFFEQAACSGMMPQEIISSLIEESLRIHAQKRGPL